MAEIEQDHERLLTDIEAAEPPVGSGMFWWLGQHTFVVKTGGKVFYIDPFFENWPSRQTRPLLTPDEGRLADYVLVTHGHGDHLAPETLAAMVTASPSALFVSPATEAVRMIEEGKVPRERLRTLNAGETLAHGAVAITAVKAKHEFFDEHPTLGFPYLGYVVAIGGLTFFHSGDGIMYDGLFATLSRWARFDAMFLPINGRDADRYIANCMGNFTFQESAELAGELRTGLVVPSHYDMFLGNQEDPVKFVRFLEAKYPGVPSWVGKAGTRVSFPQTAD